MKLNKLFKLGMLVLIIVSVAMLVWGFVVGWPKLGQEANAPVNTLLLWAAIMIGLALFCWVILDLIISIGNNPKSLVRIALIIVGAAALCGIAYVLASGNPVEGKSFEAGDLKLADTVINLTYIVGALAILAIIAGEIRMALTNKK